MLSPSGEAMKAEFATVDLPDTRLIERCQELAASLSQQPSAPINQACEEWADTKAAYRFFANDCVTPSSLGAAHYQSTAERMRGRKWGLVLQDTTFLNYTAHPQTEGLGAIGNKEQDQRGFGLHSTLVVAPSGLPLGLLDQRWLFRDPDEPSHEPNELRKLPIEEKESYRWLQAMRRAEERAPADPNLVHMGDAEADIYELIVQGGESESYYLIRASGDRCLLPETTDAPDKLWAAVTQAPLAAERDVTIKPNQERPARTATVSIRQASVTLKPPYRPAGQKLPPVSLTAVLVREEDPPEAVDEPIEWVLLTNLPTRTKANLLRVVDWYCLRWQIEDFHKILKSGCQVEACRLQTAERLQNYLTLMSVIAWRLHWFTYLNRVKPTAPCTLALTSTEWEALYMRIQETTTLPQEPPTVRQAIRWIAQLGGFLGRKGDGEPGNTVIWRGWQRLQDLAATWYLVKEQGP
jgi:hypothetical protein